jgi:hypothetical protein
MLGEYSTSKRGLGREASLHITSRASLVLDRDSLVPKCFSAETFSVTPKSVHRSSCSSHVRALAPGEFFKDLREEYLIDALAEYQVEPDDPTRSHNRRDPAEQWIKEGKLAARPVSRACF